MGLIEAILAGIQFNGLQKPIVFFTMLIGLVIFSAIGAAVVFAAGEVVLTGKAILPALGLSLFSLLFFGLAAVCGYMIKRCFQ